MKFFALLTLLFAAILLSTSSTAEHSTTDADSLPSTTQHQALRPNRPCGSCPRVCYRKRSKAVRDCGRSCTRGLACRIRRCRRSTDPSVRRGFQCRAPPRPRPVPAPAPAPAPVPVPAPAPAPGPAPLLCPNFCNANRAVSEAQCAQPFNRALGCVVRSCVLAPSGGFICALPIAQVPSSTPTATATATATVTPTPSMSPGASPSSSPSALASPSPSVTATPSVTPTPSPACTFTVQGSIGATAIDGVCQCGAERRTVTVLAAIDGLPMGMPGLGPCYNNCLRPLLDSRCTPDGFGFFVPSATVIVNTCCTACGGTLSLVTNQCVF